MVDSRDPAIVVIGSGAGGGTVAHELCARGYAVVLLEAGPRIESGDFHQDDLAAYGQLSWSDPRVATGGWLAAKVSPDRPAWVVKAVGGSTLHWNGFAFRLQAHEFRARTTYGAIAGSSLADWPFDAEELGPYYARAEAKLGVTGTGDNAPHPATNHYKVLWNGARRLGYKHIGNTRLAINSTVRDDRPGCLQLGFCNQGCKIGAKWSTLVSEIPKAEATGKLDLRTGCMAVQIEHDAGGRASAVVYVDAAGVRRRQAARVVCIAGNSIETPRLLLLSASGRFPQGLGNGAGHVGRHYMRQAAELTFAEMPQPVHMQRGIVTPGVVYDEGRHDPARGFSGGYLMQAASAAPASLALLVEPGAWGRDFSSFIERYDHLAGMLMNGEELPRADNRITLSGAVHDARGLPVAQVHVDEHPQTAIMRAHFERQSAALYRALGATRVKYGTPPSAAHNLGTSRMSLRAEEGVTDPDGRLHEVDNVYVADGSVFPTCGAENPTLTIVALAIRQSDHLASRLARGEV